MRENAQSPLRLHSISHIRCCLAHEVKCNCNRWFNKSVVRAPRVRWRWWEPFSSALVFMPCQGEHHQIITSWEIIVFLRMKRFGFLIVLDLGADDLWKTYSWRFLLLAEQLFPPEIMAALREWWRLNICILEEQCFGPFHWIFRLDDKTKSIFYIEWIMMLLIFFDFRSTNICAGTQIPKNNDGSFEYYLSYRFMQHIPGSVYYFSIQKVCISTSSPYEIAMKVS